MPVCARPFRREGARLRLGQRQRVKKRATGDDFGGRPFDVLEALERGWQRGGYREAMHQAAEALAARSNPANAMRVATLFTYAGDTERAVDWLETAYQERLQNMIYLRVHPKWDPLRSDPRFQDLVRRMNLPPLPARPKTAPN